MNKKKTLQEPAVTEGLRAIGAIFEPGDVIEIRALDVDRTETRAGCIHSGYFNVENAEAIAFAIRSLEGRAEGVYVVLNHLRPDLLARSDNRLRARPKNTTTDADIVEWRWLYIDVDAIRPAGISATDVEHEAALQKTLSIREFLAERGWPEPVHADSGNGGHLLYRLPALDSNRAGELVKRCLCALSVHFSDGLAKVDEATATPARLCKLYGTMACKGDATPERPHRRSTLIEPPEKIEAVRLDALEALASEAGLATPIQAADPTGSPHGRFDVTQWLIQFGLDVIKGPKPYKGGRRWTLRLCPFNPSHERSVVIELAGGALVHKCLHKSCEQNDWKALRALVEPSYRQSGPRQNFSVAAAEPPPPWEPPVPFHQSELPQFPVETLPGRLRAFVEAEATATQTPDDLAGMLVLSVIAAACAKKIVVQVKPNYREPVNIYTVIALPSGSRKTAVFADATAPLETHERTEAGRTAGEIAKARAAHKIKEARLRRLQDQAASAEPKDEAGLTSKAEELADELAKTPLPVPMRCIADDCTPEKLPALLADNGGRIAVMSAEGDVFDLMAGRYSKNKGGNFGVYLKGHAGDTIRVDRVGRGPEYVQAPAITVGLAVQPAVIQDLAAEPDFRGRGLLARFLYSMPSSLLGRRTVDAPPVPEQICKDYQNEILALLAMPFDIDAGGEAGPYVLQFDANARQLHQDFECWIEPQLSEFGVLGNMQDWGGKLAGAVVRIAALLHMVTPGDGSPWQAQIAAATTRNAIQIGKYLIPHAQAAFAEMGADPAVEKAKKILRWLRESGVDQFTRRDAHQAMRSTFRRPEELDGPLKILVEREFIRPISSSPTGVGRRPSPRFELNPLWRCSEKPSPDDHIGNSEYFECCEVAQVPEVHPTLLPN